MEIRRNTENKCKMAGDLCGGDLFRRTVDGSITQTIYMVCIYMKKRKIAASEQKNASPDMTTIVDVESGEITSIESSMFVYPVSGVLDIG